MTMTHRERVMAAVNHQEPDRIPVDLGGHRSSGIMAIAYKKLKDHLGISSGDIYVYDLIQQLAIIEPDLLERFRVDTVEMGRGFSLSASDWCSWTLPDGTLCQIPSFVQPARVNGDWEIRADNGMLLGIQKAGSLYFEQTHFPLAEESIVPVPDLAQAQSMQMWGAVGTPPASIGLRDDDLVVLAQGAKALRDSTDRAIIGLFGGSLFETGQMLFRNDNFFLLLAGEPAKAHRFLDQLVELHLTNLERFLSAVGPYIDIILFGDDLGMQTGPQISPKMYREFFKPRHSLMYHRAKDLTSARVMLHSCGGLYPLLPDLIEAGVDILQPVQTNCTDMAASKLKREFGDDICLWGGGCDTRDVLPHGTPQEIAEHVRRNIDILAPGGGFVFQQVHNIMADVPPENIVAMLDAVNS